MRGASVTTDIWAFPRGSLATKLHYVCSIPEGTGFFFRSRVKPGSGIRPASKEFILGLKRSEPQADHSHLHNDELLPSLAIRSHDLVINDVIKFEAF